MHQNSEKIKLILVRSSDDAPQFSQEYQAELREFVKQTGARSQRAFVSDCVGGGGGLIGEFIFDNPGKLITALTTICGVWIKARYGRKLKLKVGNTLIEANSIQEIELLVEQAKILQGKKK